MKLLLDTHVFIWLSSEPERLPRQLYQALSDHQHEIWISVASVWEISIKVAKGKLSFPIASIIDQIREMKAGLLSISALHALHASSLPPLHADPFDRMLVAQARLEGMTLVTVDRTIPQYDVTVLAEG